MPHLLAPPTLSNRLIHAWENFTHSTWTQHDILLFPLPQMGRCVCGRAAINQWSRERGGANFPMFINTLNCLHTSALSPKTKCYPVGCRYRFNSQQNTRKKPICNHDQEILRWWKLEDERRQEKPRGAHPDHERRQGGPQCRYVDFHSRHTEPPFEHLQF